LSQLTSGNTYETPDMLVKEVRKPWSEIEALTYKIAAKLGLTIEQTDYRTVFIKTD
jgi:hypothetical protein